nr:hypothetical protein [Tanacetum cinerariifolium]
MSHGKDFKEYLEKVAKHQRYLTGKEGSDPDSPTPKLSKATKKSKPSAPKADLRPPVIKPASSQQPKPKHAPAKSQEKKRKLVTKTSDKPSPTKRSKSGLVTKRRKLTSSLRSVDESVDEGILEKEPRFNNEEADIQRAVEESLKSVHDAPRGPLPPMVIKEPDFGKFQPLPEVQGKGKEKVSDKQVARDLLTLQTPKKVSPIEQYIFQRRTPASTKPSVHAESPSIYVELGLTDSDSESNEEARSDPGDDAEPQPQSSHVVHAGLNLKHMDLEATDVSTQLYPEQMDEGFGDLFFMDKPSEAENEKTTVETEAESMVSVIIQQDTSVIPPMTTPVIDLTSRLDSPNVHRPLQATATETTMTTTTTHPPPPQQQQSTTDSMLIKCIGELKQIMANLIQDNKHLEERDLPEADMKEILHQRMWDTNSYKAHEDHMMLYEALEKSINCDHTDVLLKELVEVRRKKKKRHDLPKTPPGFPPHYPPPPSPPTDLHMDDDMAPDEQVHSSDDEDIRNAHIPKVNLQQDWWKPLEEDRPATPEPAWSIPSANLHVQTNNYASALASTYTPPPEHSLLSQTGDMAMFMDWFCKRQRITELKPQDLEGPAFKLVKVFHPNAIHLQYQMEECHKLLTDSVDKSIIRYNVSKPLPLGGPPSQVMIQSDFFFNKDLEYLRYGSKGGRLALSISKMKAAYYPDVGLEQMVPDQMWIEEECKYTSEGDHRACWELYDLMIQKKQKNETRGTKNEDFQKKQKNET